MQNKPNPQDSLQVYFSMERSRHSLTTPIFVKKPSPNTPIYILHFIVGF